MTKCNAGGCRIDVRSWRLISLLITLSVVSVSCDSFPANALLGLSLGNEPGTLEIHLVPCPRERLEAIRLVQSDDAVIGDSGDENLWAIESGRIPVPATIVVGEAPPGTNELTPWKGPQTAGEQLGLLVKTNLFDGVAAFRTSDLRRGRIYSDGDRLTLAEFRERARRTCPE
jgi:hypothetical protein